MSKRPRRVARRSKGGDAPERSAFGLIVRELRGAASQHAFGELIGRPQADVARLEAGYYVAPERELLETIAEVCATSSMRVSKAQDKRAIFGRLVGGVIIDTYGVGSTNAGMLALEVRNLAELAHWERDSNAAKLWIVTPAFQDNRYPDLLDAVAHRLRHGTQVEYFVPEHELDVYGGWPRLVSQLRESLGGELDWQSRCIAHGLRDQELRWLTSSVVIAHLASELGTHLQGYVILDQDGRPAIGIRMSHDEVYRRFYALAEWLAGSGPSGKSVKAAQLVDPLAHHNRALPQV